MAAAPGKPDPTPKTKEPRDWQAEHAAKAAAHEQRRRAEMPAWIALVRDARAKVGGGNRLARAIGSNQSAVSNWLNGLRMPPATRKAQLERKLREIANA
jgi:hypothetical protein